MGFHLAGFDVVGSDYAPQPNYPFEFHRGDSLKFLLENWREFDAYVGGPPCQRFTNAQKIQGNEHPDYVAATRAAFQLIGRPYVIENVPGAPLKSPITLCGNMFGLGTYRHRLFESNFRIDVPGHPEHVARPVTTSHNAPKEFCHVRFQAERDTHLRRRDAG